MEKSLGAKEGTDFDMAYVGSQCVMHQQMIDKASVLRQYGYAADQSRMVGLRPLCVGRRTDSRVPICSDLSATEGARLLSARRSKSEQHIASSDYGTTP